MLSRFFFNYATESANKLIKNNHYREKDNRYIRFSLFFKFSKFELFSKFDRLTTIFRFQIYSTN